MKKSNFWLCLAAVFLASAALTMHPAAADSVTQNEESLGRRLAAEVEKDAKIVSGPVADRVSRIGSTLAEAAVSCRTPAAYGSNEECGFRWKFKVIENSDVNAFSLPGGYIYVNTGLLKLVESDDELAGVLAHEIAHAAHHHLTTILRQQRRIEQCIALATFVGILGNARGADLQHLLVGAQFVRIGNQSRDTLAAEEDADKTAVEYMLLAGYNPQGYIDFLRKLDIKQQDNPRTPLGILQTHPLPHRRIAYLADVLAARGINAVTGLYPEPVRARAISNQLQTDVYSVVVADKVIATLSTLSSGTSSKERAEQAADRINRALDSGACSADVRVDEDSFSILIQNDVVLTIQPEDAPGEHERRMLLSRAKSSIDYAIWAEWVRRHNGTANAVVAKR
ncbi:MAG: M48 family metalloprotease [Armatimonadota bacterium]|nr:M48 family metalloprotease [Armatimonadota bacterium]